MTDAHLWIDQGDDWGILPLNSAAVRWSPAGALRAGPPAESGLSPGVLMPSDSGWVLVCPPGSFWVNGEPVVLGMRVLTDRDELVTPSGRMFFSTESLATVVPFPGAASPLTCPRCAREIALGADAVRCPACGTWYHEGEDGRNCYTYGVCLSCDRDPSLGDGYRFDPIDLGPSGALR